MERELDRPLETLFDLLTTEERVNCVKDKDVPHEEGFLAKSVSGDLISNICRRQQILTLHRIAHWLRGNGKIFQLDWQVPVAKEIFSLAEDLDYLGDVREDIEFSEDRNANNPT